MKKLPPLPKSIPSPLGPVPVRIVKRLGGAIAGRWHPKRRVIKISAKLSREVQWQTLYHEWTHMVLGDSGLNNVLGPEQQEVLCDTFGTARVLELVSLREPKLTGSD